MKKSKGLIAIIFIIMLLISGGTIFADEFDSSKITGGDFKNGSFKYAEVSNAVNTVVGAIVIIVQILCVFGIVYAGLKYMYAGAAKKAEIKNGLIALAIGCIVVFGASTVVKLITSTFYDVSR